MRGAVGVVDDVVRIAREEHVTFLAAGIAYYAFVSIVPAILLAVVVATIVGGEALVERVLTATAQFLTPAAREQLATAVANDAGQSGATVVGLVGLTWSALKVFRGLDIAFSAVYATAPESSFLDGVRDALVVVITIGIAIAAMVGVGAALAAVELPRGTGVVGLAVLLGGLTLVFLPLYYVFPDADVSVRAVLPGTVVAAVGWVVLQTLFLLYVSLAGLYEIYGVIGGVLLLVTWFYLAAILLLVGAVVNVIAARHPRDRQVQHPGARVVRTPSMDEEDDPSAATVDPDAGVSAREDEIEALRDDLEAFRLEVEDRTVRRSEIESDLKEYVRARLRRGHARGWGPYLVLLYGTAMTIGAFYFLAGIWAILAMFVIWLSTLGLYVMMVLTGAMIHALSLPGAAVDTVRDWRS